MLVHGLALALVLAQSSFHIEPPPKTPAELSERFTPAQIEILEMLNRRDREHLLHLTPRVPGIVVPVTWDDDVLKYSPFPAEWAAAADVPKVIIVSQPIQAFGAYESGRLVRWGPTSTGRKDNQTPEGLYHLTWRSRSRRSTDNREWLLEWYFNFVNERGVSFHLFELPGYPASHACVRLLLRDAKWLYDWGEEWTLSEDHRSVEKAGTPVMILGTYAFGSPFPWLAVDQMPVVGLPDSLR
jgi:L,D-transpeptidase catalytic domain